MSEITTSKHKIRTYLLAVGLGLVLVGSLASCGVDTGQIIDEMNDQLEDDGEIYYDPNCADDDGDGWCD